MAIETTYTQARDQLKSLMDKAVADREVVLVRRRHGGDVALIAADELSSILETAHLLRSPANARRLLAALERSQHDTLSPTSVESLSALLVQDSGGSAARLKKLRGQVWSRRITQEHRLVYAVKGERMEFLQCCYHYD